MIQLCLTHIPLMNDVTKSQANWLCGSKSGSSVTYVRIAHYFSLTIQKWSQFSPFFLLMQKQEETSAISPILEVALVRIICLALSLYFSMHNVCVRSELWPQENRLFRLIPQKKKKKISSKTSLGIVILDYVNNLSLEKTDSILSDNLF